MAYISHGELFLTCKMYGSLQSPLVETEKAVPLVGIRISVKKNSPLPANLDGDPPSTFFEIVKRKYVQLVGSSIVWWT